jgi:hypothetical protein
METIQDYILEQIVRIYTVSQMPVNARGMRKSLKSNFWSQKMVYTVALASMVTFHEAQSLIYNTFQEQFASLEAQIKKVDSRSKEIIRENLREVVVKLFNWLHPSDFKRYLDPLFGNIAEAPVPDHVTEALNTPYGRRILEIFHSVKADPDRFEKAIEKEWLLLSFEPTPQFHNVDYQNIIINQLISSKDYSSSQCFFCSLALAKQVVYILQDDSLSDNEDGSDPFSLREFQDLWKQLPKLTWTFSKDDWIRLFKISEIGDDDFFDLIQGSEYSSDYLDALMETYEFPDLLKNWTSDTTVFNPITLLIGCWDSELILRLLEYPLTEDAYALISDEISKYAKLRARFVNNPKYVGPEIIRGLDPDWNRHQKVIVQHLEKVGSYIGRLPMLMLRIRHTRRLGGISILEETGYREFLDFEPYIPDFRLEKALAKK